MWYLKVTLSAVAAAIVALLIPAMYFVLRTMRSVKVMGLAFVPGGIVECLHSPLFWLLVISLFGLFLAASRLKATGLRVVFFWGPVLGALVFAALLTAGYAWIQSRHG